MRTCKKFFSKAICMLLIVQFLLPVSWQQSGAIAYADGETVTDSVYSGVYGASPSAPANLSAVPVSYNQIAINWDPPVGQVSQYHVFRDGVQITSVTANVYAVGAVSYSDTGLLPSTAYSYELEAVDNVGNVSAKTPSVHMVQVV